jgi:hypothetical protein
MSAQTTSNQDSVIIAYLKYLNTKLLLSNNLMSRQDEKILGIIFGIMDKRKTINQESMLDKTNQEIITNLLSLVLMRRRNLAISGSKMKSKHFHWRMER